MRQQKFTDFVAKAKICMRYAETNKNFRETRCAQKSGNFYWLSVNTAKFLMPRSSVNLTSQMLIIKIQFIILYS